MVGFFFYWLPIHSFHRHLDSFSSSFFPFLKFFFSIQFLWLRIFFFRSSSVSIMLRMLTDVHLYWVLLCERALCVNMWVCNVCESTKNTSFFSYIKMHIASIDRNAHRAHTNKTKCPDLNTYKYHLLLMMTMVHGIFTLSLSRRIRTTVNTGHSRFIYLLF